MDRRTEVMGWLEELSQDDWMHWLSDSEVQNTAKAALELLIEDCHNCKLECLLQKYDQLKEKYDKLLKEQEAVAEYVIDEFQPTCKACGFRPFAGYIPSLEWMRERGFKFCPQCGKTVKWNG